MQAGATETNDADEPEEESLFFVEADEVLGLITSFSDPEKTAAAHAAAAERVAHVLDRYQEQPTVLDPQLEAMVVPLLEAVRAVARDGASRELLPHTCRVMYTLCKVRGYKTIVRFVPHEVADLEPLVALLMSLDPTDYASWQVAYSLMVWLCMVVMVPFDLAIIDSGQVAAADGADADAAAPLTLVGKILQFARLHLGSTWPAREAAAVLLARLLTRPGMQAKLREFVQWGAAKLAEREAGGEGHDEIKSSFLMAGIYSALACAMKLGHRVELLPTLTHLAALTSNPKALLEDPSVTREIGRAHV